MINQGKRDDLTTLNKENMLISYEIDELVDRINAKKQEAKKQHLTFVGGSGEEEGTAENIGGAASPTGLQSSLKKNMSQGKLRAAGTVSQASVRVESQFPVLDLARVSQMP